MENFIIPSFTPDLSELDEEGIRWDVRQSIKHGFFSTMCAAEVGLSFEEAKRFVEIVADEAKDRILVSTSLIFNSFKQIKEMVRHAHTVGCHSALLYFPPNFFPKSEEEIYQAAKEICDASDIGIVLYTSHKFNFEKFHPAGFSPALLSRMADIDNVIGMKIGSNDFGYIADCFEKCGDRILVNCPLLGMAPFTTQSYGQQWIGAAVFELFQSPESRYLVDYYNFILSREMDKAMDIYRRLTPVMQIFEFQMLPSIMIGAYHWTLFKYYQWLVGGNGGLLRQPVLNIQGFQTIAVKMALHSIGITPREPEEEFYIGRSNYGKKRN
jgi:4-hydroxy-tetrahydrodipicolinate synthase